VSAYVVDEAHIHFLVNAGLSLTSRLDSKLRWFVRPLTDEEKDVAYRPGEAWGPGAMSVYGELRRELTDKNTGWVGAMLWAENARSVNHRYNEEEWEQPYLFRRLPGVPNPVAVLKALDGFEYQSCEHPGWETSEAHSFCASLRKTAIRRLKGYDDAPWEVTNLDLLQVMKH
jgi:hypothetical protein